MTEERAKEIVRAVYPEADWRPTSTNYGLPRFVISKRRASYFGWLTNMHRSVKAAWIKAAKNVLEQQKAVR